MHDSSFLDTLRLVGLGGSNKVMAGELSRLARRAFPQERARQLLEQPPRKQGPGALVYPFAPDLAALAVTYHRTSARVLWDLAWSSASRLDPFYEDLLTAFSGDERGWAYDGAGISVQAFHPSGIAAGERQIVGTVKNALIEAAARRGMRLHLSPESPDLTFHVRDAEVEEGTVKTLVSVDLAGRPMHQRGYRTKAGQAPLREDLAANLVMLARYDAREEIFIDPMAGSGTLAIEAALMGAGKPIWMSGRKPDAHRLALLKPHLEGFKKPLFADTAPRIFAGDIDEEVYGALDRSLATAGTSPQTTTFLGDFRDWDLAPPLQGSPKGLILSNPPYGARLSASVRELRALYRDLASWCAQFPGFRAGFIVGEPTKESEREEGPSTVRLFMEAFGDRPRVKKPISNGPLRAQFLLYDL